MAGMMEKAGLAALAISQELVAAHPGVREYREILAYIHGSRFAGSRAHRERSGG